ncbi:MAG: hypothetical protein WCV68_00660 [Candidatus Paceibacterota bacterium]|jgi:hypothetical protein
MDSIEAVLVKTTQENGKYVAYLEENPEVRGEGDCLDAALGNLVRNNPEACKFIISEE